MSAKGRRAPCHLCGSTLTAIDGYEDLKRVTSDGKPWKAGGMLAFCESCGVAQAVVDDTWHEEAAAIYADYGIYLRSGGKEQVVFDGQGNASSRSDQLFRRMREQAALADSGDVLDIGCSNGGTLRSFSSSFPVWRCHGLDLNNRFEAEVRAAVDLHGFHTGSPAALPRTFDLVTMFHVLEHIPAPREYLREVASRLAPGGMLFVEVPDCAVNPFVLLVADHSCHFWTASLRDMLEAIDMRIVTVTSSWVAKEISCLAAPGAGGAGRPTVDPRSLLADLRRSVECLLAVRAQAREAARTKRPFGMFGTAIAATWLYSELGGAIDFFVDEDAFRIGTTYFDKPIISPADAPKGATVYLPFAPNIAQSIAGRLDSARVSWVAPPAEGFQMVASAGAV